MDSRPTITDTKKIAKMFAAEEFRKVSINTACFKGHCDKERVIG